VWGENKAEAKRINRHKEKHKAIAGKGIIYLQINRIMFGLHCTAMSSGTSPVAPCGIVFKLPLEH